MKKVFLLFLLTTQMIYSQNCSVKSYIIKSEILNEDRIVDIQFPKHYNNAEFSKASYPVLYVIDGGTKFQYIASLERFYTDFVYRSLPEMIVIGIRNTDRDRDLTPTHLAELKTSGGAGNFTKFIEKELQPYIDKNFRTNGFNILWGHSFGGLFALNTLLQKPELFKSYVVVDPSLWWDKQYIIKQFKNNWKHAKFDKQKELYLAIANEKNLKKKRYIIHAESILLFNDFMIKNPKSKIRYKSKIYEDFNHGDVSLPASIDGLRNIFNGIKLPVKTIPKNFSLFKEYYQNLSNSLEFEMFPDESLFHQFLKLSKTKFKSDELYEKVLDYALECYPKSPSLLKMRQELNKSN